jgi:hypothetical protein
MTDKRGNMTIQIDPDKYVVFKRDELIQLFGELALPPWEDRDGSLLGQDIDCAPLAEKILACIHDIELHDAVVIRKTDRLASGALHSYATAAYTTADILLECGRTDDAEEITAIGDYFIEQYEGSRQMQDHLPTA